MQRLGVQGQTKSSSWSTVATKEVKMYQQAYVGGKKIVVGVWYYK